MATHRGGQAREEVYTGSGSAEFVGLGREDVKSRRLLEERRTRESYT